MFSVDNCQRQWLDGQGKLAHNSHNKNKSGWSTKKLWKNSARDGHQKMVIRSFLGTIVKSCHRRLQRGKTVGEN